MEEWKTGNDSVNTLGNALRNASGDALGKVFLNVAGSASGNVESKDSIFG